MVKDIFKKLEKYYLLFLIIFAFILVHFFLTKDLVSLPSPLYGGDYYFQLGQTNHVKYGGNPLESSTLNGQLPAYFISYSFFSGMIGRVFNIEGITAEYIFSLIIIILACVILFFLFLKLFNNKYISAIGTLLFVTPMMIPVVKYTDFARILLMPLLVLTIFNFISKKNITNAVFLGLVYGIIGITHSVAFIASSLLLASIFIYYELIKNFKNLERKKILEIMKKTIIPYAIVAVIGVCIALLWWYKPIFVYHSQTSLHYVETNSLNLSTFKSQLDLTWQFISGLFFNFTNIIEGIRSIFIIIGVGLLFFLKKHDESISFIRNLFIISFIVALHFWITERLLGTNFIPTYINGLLLTFAGLLLSVLGIYLLYELIKDKLEKWQKITILCTFFVLIIVGQIFCYQIRHDHWYKAGLQTLPEHLGSLKEYLNANSKVTDTILTTKEVGFAVNSLSGRKLLICRRAQNDPFVDMDKRELDAAIILYGNDMATKFKILKEHNIKYLYWDYYWIQSEYTFDDQGRITNWFDPLMIFYSKENEQRLLQNNVSYFIQNTWLDPTLRNDDIKKFDIIFISPQNYVSTNHPWNANLDPYLEEVWHYDYQGQRIAVLYKIKY